MFLSETKIYNYKIFRHKIQVQTFSPGLNILVGINGSGKTTLIEAINLLFFGFNKSHIKNLQLFNSLTKGPLQKSYSIIQISLENLDRKFPLKENSIIIRRVMTKTLDKFLISNQSFSLVQFFSFLDSLGLCRENLIIGMRQGEQVKLKELDSLARSDFVKKMIGGKIFSRFKVKILLLLKNINLYKKKVSKRIIELREEINSSFEKRIPSSKKITRANFFIFQKESIFSFRIIIQKKQERIKSKKIEKNVLKLGFSIRKTHLKKKIFFLFYIKQANFLKFLKASLYSCDFFSNFNQDCNRLKKLVKNLTILKIQENEKNWERSIKSLCWMQFRWQSFWNKKKKIFNSQNSIKIWEIKFFSLKNLSKGKFPYIEIGLKNFFGNFFEQILFKKELLKFQNFKLRQKISFLSFIISKEIEHSEKNLIYYEKKLTQKLGNKTLFGIRLILGLFKQYPKKRTKVFGLMVDLFSIHRFFFKPIENFLQKTLSFIVVEDKKTAFWLIKILRKKMPFKANFLLLKSQETKKTKEFVNPEFFPIIFVIFFRPKFSFLFRNFFYNVFLSNNPFKNYLFSRRLGAQLVTLEGEVFFSNGIISSGFKEKKKSFFEIVSKLKNERRLLEVLKRKSQQIKNPLYSFEEKIKKILSLCFFSDKFLNLKTQKIFRIDLKNERFQNSRKFTKRTSFEKKYITSFSFSKNKKFLKFKKLLFLYSLEIDSVKKWVFIKDSLLFMGQFFFFTKSFSIGLFFVKQSQFFPKKKNGNNCTQKKVNWFSDKKKKSKKKSRKHNFLGNQKNYSFFDSLLRKFPLPLNCSSLERILKKTEGFLNFKYRPAETPKLFSKKEKLDGLLFFGKFFKKKKGLLTYQKENKEHVQKKTLIGLINCSREIESDLFIVSQVFETFLIKKRKILKKSLSKVSKSFFQVFRGVISEGKACIIVEITDFFLKSKQKKEENIKKSGLHILAKFGKNNSFLFLEQMSNGQTSLVSIILLLSIGKIIGVFLFFFDEADSNLDSRNCSLLAFLFKKISSMGFQFLISTFRKETILLGDKWFRIFFDKKLTKIRNVLKKKALKVTFKTKDF